ncbi:MAG: DMT family transporter, partial [Bacteroidota bacterium]
MSKHSYLSFLSYPHMMPLRGKLTLSPTLWGAIMVFIGAIGSSSKAVLAKLAYLYGIDAISLLAIRMLMVFPIFAAIAWLSYRRLGRKPAAKYYLQLLPIGLLGYYLASFLDFQGLQYVPAAIERLILFNYPTLVVLLSRLIFKTPIRPRQWVALALAYAGILIVLVGDVQLAQTDGLWKGGIWIFMAALCYSSYILGSHQLLPIFGVGYFTSLAMSIASVGVFIHSFINGTQVQDMKKDLVH